MKGITVVVVGTGRFGQHYSRILAKFNKEKIPGVPPIDMLVVTKTDLKKAQEAATLLQMENQDSIPRVTGAKVCHGEDLTALLDQYSPKLTCIVASDKLQGDSVHAEYTKIALKKGNVLCEKPFSNARGDGASLKMFEELSTYPNADQFGMELPLVIACQQLLSQDALSKQFLKTSKLNFHWGTVKTMHTDLIDDLALHPWSLIPDYIQLKEIQGTDNSEKTTTIRAILNNTRTKNMVTMHLTLSGKSNFRALETDNLTLAFPSNGPVLNIVKSPFPIEKTVKTGITYPGLPVLDTVHNPVAQHIIAALKGSPLVDLKRTYQSQLFLETLKGYHYET